MTMLKTSPLLFIRPGKRSSIEGRNLNTHMSAHDVELLSFFMEGKDETDALASGFSPEDIEKARKEGLLVETGKDQFARGETWEAYNLQRAAHLMFMCQEQNRNDSPAGSDNGTVETAESFSRTFRAWLNRRTQRFFSDEPLEKKKLDSVVRELSEYLRHKPWLSLCILAQSVEELNPGIYRLNSTTGELVLQVDHFKRKDLLECLHGQWWLNGGGVCCFFVVSIKELSRHLPGYPKSYFEMTIELGSAGQALVNAAYRAGLGSWMTPALSETLAGKILGLNPDEEQSLYFFKVGIPQKATDERRSPI